MTSLDADLVHRWFGRLRDAEDLAMPRWGIVPTEQEATAFAEGEAQIEFAVQDLPPPRMVAPLSEVPARSLRTYLQALAAGISGTRQLLTGSAGDGLFGSMGGEGGAGYADGPAGAGGAGDSSGAGRAGGAGPAGGAGRDADRNSPGAVGGRGDASGADGDPDALALVTGLNAAAAALHGQIKAPADRPFQVRSRMNEPSAAEAARLAGLTAADLVVDGAGLQRIATSAAGAAMNGWQIGLPEDPAERDEYRTRGLVGLLLHALAQETRDPEPPAEPASCGALPGDNTGRAFEAEITFSMGLAPAEIRSLAADLEQVSAEVTVWSTGQWPSFHVHSDRPGEVVGQIYAYGTPFDLMITDRH